MSITTALISLDEFTEFIKKQTELASLHAIQVEQAQHSSVYPLSYTTQQTSEQLHIHEEKINTLRRLGVLKGIKKGKGYIFPKFILDKFLEDYLDKDITTENDIINARNEVEREKAQKKSL